MNAPGLKAACLAVGLATAWGPQADAQFDEIQLTITPSNSLSHVYFLYGRNVTGGLWALSATPLPDLVGGESTTETFSVSHDWYPGHGYAVIGLYDAPNNSVTIGIWSPEAESIYGNSDFSNVFSLASSTYGTPFYSEASLATAMLSNDITTIMSAIDADDSYGIDLGSTGDLVNFSNANRGGSVFAEIIPEPSPLLLVIFGALVIPVVQSRCRCLIGLRVRNIRGP